MQANDSEPNNWCVKEYIKIRFNDCCELDFYGHCEEIDGRKLNGQKVDIWLIGFKNALWNSQY